jgi:hypothetical protein
MPLPFFPGSLPDTTNTLGDSSVTISLEPPLFGSIPRSNAAKNGKLFSAYFN